MIDFTQVTEMPKPDSWAYDLCEAAIAAGFTLSVAHPEVDELDYTGTDLGEAWAAITACDEMEVTFSKPDHKTQWALLISSLDPDEQIADYAGKWIDAWFEAKARAQ
jgi:hypothetical protein